jgi:hypothetical protein
MATATQKVLADENLRFRRARMPAVRIGKLVPHLKTIQESFPEWGVIRLAKQGQ